ncbi:ATP-grasp domain-containing protein, partial [Patescibacteria group bacterium]
VSMSKLLYHENISMPCVVKPNKGGSSVGIYMVKNLAELKPALKKALFVYDEVIVEEFIEGREATCSVVDYFRDTEAYSLIPIEIVTLNESEFFDYEAKYSDVSEKICPSRFSLEESEDIQNLAKTVHKALV